MRYDNFEAMVAPARPKAELWRLVAGLGTGTVIYIALSTAFFLAVGAAFPGVASGIVGEGGVGRSPAGALVILFGFSALVLAAVIVTRVLHGRMPRSLIGPAPAFRRDFLSCLKWLGGLLVVLFLVPAPDAPELIPNLAPQTWLALLPIALAGLFIQVSAEEIVFRGYVQQQLAARFRSPLMWMILPAVIFGAAHYAEADAGDNAIYIAGWAAIFGIAAADLTARAGNLGPAIAFHLVNNASAMLIAALPGPLSGLALYVYPFTADDLAAMRPFLVIDLLYVLVAWLACRVAIRR